MDTALPRRMPSNTNQVSREMTLEEWCEKVPSIHLINREFKELKDKAAYWEAKALEYKALLENMERVK